MCVWAQKKDVVTNITSVRRTGSVFHPGRPCKSHAAVTVAARRASLRRPRCCQGVCHSSAADYLPRFPRLAALPLCRCRHRTAKVQELNRGFRRRRLLVQHKSRCNWFKYEIIWHLDPIDHLCLIIFADIQVFFFFYQHLCVYETTECVLSEKSV